MAHIWLRAEQRPNERRTPLTAAGATALVSAGHRVAVEDAPDRAVATATFRDAGARIVPAGAWPDAPPDAVILGLKELPDDGTPLVHTHVMFGHAYKDQPGAARLLGRFATGGGTLLDLEYLLDEGGRRLVAFGHWAGYAGAAVTLRVWADAKADRATASLGEARDPGTMAADAATALRGAPRPSVIVVGALGRVGGGARTLCDSLGVQVTAWDLAETAHGGPFPEILRHDVLLNCILAGPGAPILVGAEAGAEPRRLRAVGDIACDPDSAFTPIRVNDRTTDWNRPARRVAATPPLDVVAIDNLPALLPHAASVDFAGQLLPHLMTLDDPAARPWAGALARFRAHLARTEVPS